MRPVATSTGPVPMSDAPTTPAPRVSAAPPRPRRAILRSAATKALAVLCALALALPVPALADELGVRALGATFAEDSAEAEADAYAYAYPDAYASAPSPASPELPDPVPDAPEPPVASPVVTASVADESEPPEQEPAPEATPAQPTPTPVAVKMGWVFDRNAWYWYDTSGEPVAGWQDIFGERFYFHPETHAMCVGWNYIDDAWYFFEPHSTGMQGRLLRGWLLYGDTWYYLSPLDGSMATGWQWIDGVWYYLNPSGSMRLGWLCDGGVWYYFGGSGAMLKGRHSIDGMVCCFDSDGACTKTGWQNPAGLYQASVRNVFPVNASAGIFSYISPSQITLDGSRSQAVETFVGRAMDYLGTPYMWDYACAPGVGVDCSGLVMQALCAIGMTTPYDPWLHITDPWQDHNAKNMFEDSKFMWVQPADRQRGDLVFYDGHCAICLGGDLCVEAWPGMGVVTSNIWTKPNGKGRIPLGFRRVCV